MSKKESEKKKIVKSRVSFNYLTFSEKKRTPNPSDSFKSPTMMQNIWQPGKSPEHSAKVTAVSYRWR